EVVLSAAKLHARLHPYIYSAAIDAFETGFPWSMAPLPLVYPGDAQVYDRENATIRGYQWMLGPSLLAVPLYGNDYATATTRDVYLPAGNWIDYDTGELHGGPKLLKDFSLPVGKTPLFVGGKGVLVLRNLQSTNAALRAVIYPVATRGTSYRFTHRDGKTRSQIFQEHTGWNAKTLTVTEVRDGRSISFKHEPRTGAIEFPLTPGHDYRLGGGSE
ncbi:MAG TPA: hypothetical protein VK530_15985, partial [Candidatus Acidoferrum sp.]|nr:hypothetical protein [Candidatus Acidoferrum sp.]